MKKPNTIRHFTNNMQRAALAVCMAALVALTAGSAHALTTTSVIDLGAQGSGTALGGGAKVEKIAKAALPVGSILRSVAIDARIDAGDPYVGDICVFFASRNKFTSKKVYPNHIRNYENNFGFRKKIRINLKN